MIFSCFRQNPSKKFVAFPLLLLFPLCFDTTQKLTKYSPIMANWMKKYFSNGSDDGQAADGCRLSTYSSRKCSYQNGEMKCRNEKRVMRHCPGKEPQVVESTVEDSNGAPEDGSFTFQILDPLKS
jgi:hypothetical protein